MIESTLPHSTIFPVLTLLRTGTWWHKYFWYYFAEAMHDGEKFPDVMGDHPMHDFRKHLGAIVFVGHCEAPGFRGINLPISERWKSIEYASPGYNVSFTQMNEHLALFDLGNPLNPGYAYLFRNPLDHFVSIYEFHVRNRTGELSVERDGKPLELESAFDLAMFNSSSYIKQFLSHLWMSRAFPGRVLMCRYETIVEDPEAHFRRMLKFFGYHSVDPKCLYYAMNRSETRNLKSIESRTGHRLGGGFDKPDHRKEKSHFGDGRVEKWREHFSKEQFDEIDAAFAEWDIPLTSFGLNW